MEERPRKPSALDGYRRCRGFHFRSWDMLEVVRMIHPVIESRHRIRGSSEDGFDTHFCYKVAVQAICFVLRGSFAPIGT